jgi:predicted ferric reductase
MRRHPFKVADVAFTNNGEFMLLYLTKPPGYTYKLGQYVFVNIPSVSMLQWHPYSIGSSPNNKYLLLMVKNNGDWSHKLINLFKSIKKSSINVNKREFEGLDKDKIMKLILNYDTGTIAPETEEASNILFPRINVSASVSAPSQLAAKRKNLIMVGAGSGISPFLAFLDD